MRNDDIINYFGGKGNPQYTNELQKYITKARGVNGATKFLDLFGGGGHLILTYIDDFKSGIYNEYDRCLVDLFEIIKEGGAEQKELLHLINITKVDKDSFKKLRYIWDNLAQYTSENECNKTYEDAGLDKVKRAFIPYAISCCSHDADLINFDKGRASDDGMYQKKKKSIEDGTMLLRNVEIIKGDYEVQLEKYKDDKDCVIVLDPPYVHETRSKDSNYVKEWDAGDHERLISNCLKVSIPLIICGYETECTEYLYGKLVEQGWEKVALLTDTSNSGKIEYIWHNINLL